MPGFGDKSYESKYPKAGGSKSEWLKLEKALKVGDTAQTPIRFVSQFEDFGKHRRDNKTYVCIGADQGCPDCPKAAEIDARNEGKTKDAREDNPFRVSPRFLAWVKDLRDGQVKLFEYGWSVQGLLENLAEDGEWEFVDGIPNFNIKINCTKTGPLPQNVEYDITPSPKVTPLSEEDKAAVAKLNPIKDIVKALRNKSAKEQGIQETAHAPAPADQEKEEIAVENIPF